jgi:hypothetical protein
MVERIDRSRRKVLRGVVNGVSTGLLLRVASAQAAEKMTRQQAEYQDTPNGIYSCAVCTLFEQPKSCKVVEGEVSRDAGARSLRWPIDVRSDGIPFKIRDFIPHHSRLRFGHSNHDKADVFNRKNRRTGLRRLPPVNGHISDMPNRRE